MKRRPGSWFTVLFAALPLLFVACSDEGTSGGAPGQPPPATISSTGRPLEWTEPNNYTYVLESRCGERALIGIFEVTVEGHEVQDVVALDEDAAAMLEHSGTDPAPTIGELITRLQTATQNGADRVHLEVDADDGHPAMIEIDFDTNAIDDEACYTITDFDPQAVVMTEEWAEAAVVGDLDQAGELTYGEAGEPDALEELARSLTAYRNEYGPPVIEIDGYHELGDLQVVCLRFDYQDFAVDGGMVLRVWPEAGLKLWEYRTGLSNCVDRKPGVTTTLPEVPTSS